MNLGSQEPPPGWLFTTIGEVTRPVVTTRPADKPDVGFQYLDISSIDNQASRITTPKQYLGNAAPSRARQVVAENDTLFSTVRTYLKNIAMVPRRFHGQVASTGFAVLRPASGIEPNFLFHYTLTGGFLNPLGELQRGSSYPAVRDEDVRAQKIPIPPSAEQKRIVAKIEELFSELDKGIETLKLARAQLEVYRQALLKHAFEGKLTADWRATRASQLESADQLFARIRAEREARYQQQLADWQGAVQAWESADQKESKPSKPRKPVDVAPLTDEDRADLFELPGGWRWLRLGSNNVDVFDGPFGSNLKTSDYVGAGVRVVRLENIGVLQFIEEKESFISEDKYRGLMEHTIVPGDIVFSSFVTERTRVAMVPKSIQKAVNKSDCFCLRCHGSTLLNRYACVFLSTRFAYKQLEAVIHGVGRPRINTTQLKELFMPVCSPTEQIVMMDRIDAQLSALDELDKTVESELQKAEALRQSILKKAFAGELVMQDPADEPAAALLARIRAERAAQGAVPKTKPKIMSKKSRAAKA